MEYSLVLCLVYGMVYCLVYGLVYGLVYTVEEQLYKLKANDYNDFILRLGKVSPPLL
jgi:thiamine transporter ThiT